MNILEFVLDFNEKVLGQANITKSVYYMIKGACKSQVIQDTNLEDGKDHKIVLDLIDGSGSIQCNFCSHIGVRSAWFSITGLEKNTYWERELDPNCPVTVHFNMHELENRAFYGWKGPKAEIASINYFDGKFNNYMKFFMKTEVVKHGPNKGELENIRIFVRGGNEENYYPIISKKGKIFKGVEFDFYIKSWSKLFNMTRSDEKKQQEENYKNFDKQKAQKKADQEKAQQEKRAEEQRRADAARKAEEQRKAEQERKSKQQKEEQANKEKQKSSSNNQSNSNSQNKQSQSSQKQNEESGEAPRPKDRFTSTDYYQMLGVKENASTEEIRKAYRTIMLKIHPDISKEYYLQEVAQKINAIKDVLLDPERRKEYDAYLRATRERQQG